MIGLLCISMLVMLIVGVPVAVSLGTASILTLIADSSIPLQIVPQQMFSAVNSFSLLCVPFFLLAGTLMEEGGLTDKLVDFANALIGWLKCGLVYVSVLVGMLLGGVSGSSAADTAALSSVMIPAMERNGYKRNFSAALQASSGAIGVIIPPSIPMIIMGGITGASIDKLFIGGILPGILVGLLLMIAGRLSCAKQHMGETDLKPFSLKELWRSFKQAILPLLTPVIIMGGIIGGVFTATEASVVAAIYTFIIGFFVYKKISIKRLLAILVETGEKTAQVMFVVSAATAFSWLLSAYNIPKMAAEFLYSLSTSPAIIMFIMMFIFWLLAMFIDETPLIIMLLPVMLPIATGVGIHPIVFCIMIAINTGLGAIMPPVGTAVFVASASGKLPPSETIKQIFPFVGAYIVCMVIITAFPSLVTYLPSVVG